MRATDRKGGFSVHAISGTRAVLLAMNAERDATHGLLGFAIGHRHTAGGGIGWLRGFKFFEALVPSPAPGERHESIAHPFQTFLWGHYSATPDTNHHYVVRPLFLPDNGDLGALRSGEDMEVSVCTEREDDGRHSILFNRGAIVSQAYEDRFGVSHLTPEELEEELNDPTAERTRWLSRGLLEGALDFIAQARSSRFTLHCGFYEFDYLPVIQALSAAAGWGARVEVTYEAGHVKVSTGVREETSTGARNAAAIAPFQGQANLHFRERVNFISLTHNKFMVLLEDGRPVQVWTGSTNITPSGFAGQSNNAHIVRDEAVARKYEEYWQVLARDELRAPFKAFNRQHTPEPEGSLPANSITPFFSPRPGSSMLDWYGARLDEAQQTVLLTSAFGVTPRLAAFFDNDRDYLRFVLMEQKSRGEGAEAMLRRDRDTIVVLGQGLGVTGSLGNWRDIPGFELERWFHREHHFRSSGHVFFVHTKYMAIDPLTDDPLVFTGSANFSPGSLSSNDENMLLIRGEKSVSDVYLTEFFRLLNHFYFREIANRLANTPQTDAGRAVFLDPTDGWVAGHFRSQNYRSKRRELFGVAP